MVTDYRLMDVVEAAHIWPYSGEEDNHPANGLLLRTDIHTLFDLELMGIDPAGYFARSALEALEAGHAVYEGTRLGFRGSGGPERQLLGRRWQAFLSASGD